MIGLDAFAASRSLPLPYQGIRDPECPCPARSFDAGDPDGECNTDGHYLCRECKHARPEVVLIDWLAADAALPGYRIDDLVEQARGY